jgi:hypothetical protein
MSTRPALCPVSGHLFRFSTHVDDSAKPHTVGAGVMPGLWFVAGQPCGVSTQRPRQAQRPGRVAMVD